MASASNLRCCKALSKKLRHMPLLETRLQRLHYPASIKSKETRIETAKLAG